LGTKPSWIEGLVLAILHTSEVNVIAVDWVYGSTGAYRSAVENVTQLALSISQFISKLLVSYCAFPVWGEHGQRTSFVQTIQSRLYSRMSAV